MPVSINEWRVRIGTFICRQRKEYDYFWRKLDNLIKRTKNAESSKEKSNAECNISFPTCSSNSSGGNTDHHTASSYIVNLNTAQTGPSCDINNSRGNINSQIQSQCDGPGYDTITESGSSFDVKSPGNKDTSHSQSLCAKAKETDPGTDSTEVQNPVTNPCEEDELDNRYITIHRISISNKTSPEYPVNSTQGSKTDQSDLSIIGMNNHSPEAVADGPVLGLESTRPAREETSNAAPSGIEDQPPGLSPEPGQDTTRNAEQITPIEKEQKCHGSETYPVLGSGPTSGEADAIKDIDCPGMTNTLLLRSGDVELNPGPNDTPIEESREQDFDDLLKVIAKQIPMDIDIDSLGKELGFEPAEIQRYIHKNEKYQTVTYMGTLSMLRDWRKRTTRSEEREKMKKVLLAIKQVRLVDYLLNDVSASRARPTEESREQDFDDVLKTVASRIVEEYDIDSLGKALGFESVEIQRYIQTNHKYQLSSYMGTLNMLRDWKKRTAQSEEREKLGKALFASGQDRLAKEILDDDMARQTDIDPEKAIMNGTAPWNRSRIMVIGPGGVGKTSLIRRLTGQKFNLQEKSTKGAERNVVTNSKVCSWALDNEAQTAKDDLLQSIAMYHDFRNRTLYSTRVEENRGDPGITGSNRSGDADEFVTALSTSENERIAKISLDIPREEITKVKSSKLDITYSMWDFGGQEIYYITHPLFLSWRSLYILVIPLHLELSDRAPREEDAEHARLKGSAVRTHRTILDLVHFWLMSVNTHAVPDSNLDSKYEPKVLLIGTFAGDEGPQIKEEKGKSKFQELKGLLGSKPYWKQVIDGMCVIDNQFSQTSEVNEIQDRIDGLIKDSEYMKDRKPVKWRTFLTEIEGSDQNTLTVTEARSIMNTLGINDGKEVDDVLKFYHDIGHLIYHLGCELIVLKPQFLNSIVSNIITVIDDKKMEGDLAKYWRDLMDKGILSIELIKAVWKEHKGDHDQLNNIIDMMMKFDLICEIPDRPDGKRGFFVPCRSSPKLDEGEIHGKDDKVEFTIDFHHFLPDGFLHRFYVRMAQWSMERKKSIQPTFHCRQMVFYIDNGHRVVMTNDIKKGHAIKVMIYAVTPFGAPSDRTKASVSLNKKFIDCLHERLEYLKELWARRIRYRVGRWCPKCPIYNRKGWIDISDILKDQDETACCDEGCAIHVGDIMRAFNKGTQLPSEKQGDSSIGVHVDAANSSSVTGNTFIGQQNITKHSRYSHGSEDDSLGEPSTSTKRDKKTNPKTDSTTDENKRTRRDKRTISDGSEDDSLDGRPRKSKKKTDRQTDSSDEDGRSRGNNRTLEVSDAMLTKLARYIPNDAYDTFSEKLGIALNQARNIVVMYNNNYEKATRDCMAKWRDASTRSVADLHDVLREAKLGGLTVHCN